MRYYFPGDFGGKMCWQVLYNDEDICQPRAIIVSPPTNNEYRAELCLKAASIKYDKKDVRNKRWFIAYNI